MKPPLRFETEGITEEQVAELRRLIAVTVARIRGNTLAPEWSSVADAEMHIGVGDRAYAWPVGTVSECIRYLQHHEQCGCGGGPIYNDMAERAVKVAASALAQTMTKPAAVRSPEELRAWLDGLEEPLRSQLLRGM